jgi:TatD DNase family protein
VIDFFHCHLDLYPEPDRIARECATRGLDALSVTNTPSAWIGTVALGRGSVRIQTALGLHPQLAHERKSELNLFEKLLPETRYVGEIGLDGMPEFSQHGPDQAMVFSHILNLCARAGGRVLSIHSRRAVTQVLDALERCRRSGTPVLHWFSGSQRELAHAVDLGCWFSIGPAMLAGHKGRRLAAKMPRDRVLTESDGPFAQLDGRAILPWDVGRAATALAELWMESMDRVREQLTSNLRIVLGALGPL